MAVYVDDLLIAGRNPALIKKIINALKRYFQVKELGLARWILGIAITRDTHAGITTIHQHKYIQDMVLAIQPYLVPLHGRLPPHDKLIASNRVPLHAKYRFASWIITNITHHCNVPSVAAQPTVTP
jgi:hypothetical protein